MGISDWSSDLCSSDLHRSLREHRQPCRGLYRARKIVLAQLTQSHRTTARSGAFLPCQPFRYPAPGCHCSFRTRHRIDCASSRRSEEHTSELQSLMRISYADSCSQKNIKQTIKPTQRVTHL